MRLVKIGENSLQYSLQDTTRHALFLVASRVEKFVGKTAVDTVAVRLGAIMSTLMVLLGTHLGWSTATFAAINVVLRDGLDRLRLRDRPGAPGAERRARRSSGP